MLSDYELYIQLCTKEGIASATEVLEALKTASTTGDLRLPPCLTIALPICKVIGRVLMSSSSIRSVNLSDCMLVCRALDKILEALREGSSVESLNLKGNNISGQTVSQLGDIFHHNNTLKHLSIEWNNLGADVEAFAKFCSGISVNHNIKELDLRHNQITPSCAQSLSTVLARNKSLKVVNLAWNTLGNQGGQLLLNGLKENSSVIKLNLQGNCVPDQIIDAIDDCLARNQSKLLNTIGKIAQLQVGSYDETTDKVSSLEPSTKHQKYPSESPEDSSKVPETHDEVPIDTVSKVQDVPSQKNSTIEENYNETELNIKISELNTMLRDRASVINHLTSELAIKNAEIEASEAVTTELKTEIDKIKTEYEESIAKKLVEIISIKKEQKKSEETWTRINRELKEAHDLLLARKKSLEEAVSQLENKIRLRSEQIVAMRKKWAVNVQLYEDSVAKSRTEIHRLRGESREKDARHRVEINILKNSLKETTRGLEECQEELQKTRSELLEARAQLREMEFIREKNKRLDECLHRTKEERGVTAEKLADAQRSISSLARQVKTLETELIEPQRRSDLLREELEQEQQKNGRLKQELVEERLRMKEQDHQIQQMIQQISSLNLQISDLQRIHSDDVRERDQEKKQLQDLIAIKERDFNDLKAQEVQRASHLYAAFSKYLGATV